MLNDIFKKIIENNTKQRDDLIYSEVLFRCQNESPDLYAVRHESIYTPDDELNCGEPWHDYGNYKKVGITDKNSIYSLWDVKTRTLYLYSKETKKFYAEQDQGQWWNHSSSNDTPGRRAFGEEITPTEIMKKSLEMYFSTDTELEITEYWKECKSEQLLQKISNVESELGEAEAKLEDLKTNHPRAWKQIENIEIQIENIKKRSEKLSNKYALLNEE